MHYRIPRFEPKGPKHRTTLAFFSGLVIVWLTGPAWATSAGIDLNLSTHARAGGMAGAAYTRPQEASAAVFGNPATLTQFKGLSNNFSATFLTFELDNVQSFAGATNTSTARHKDYIVPNIGLTAEVVPGLVLGVGLEVDAGLGADYRGDPFLPLAGAEPGLGFAEPIGLPLLVEVISFNANVGAGFQVTPKTSIGASVTIGFGLAQLGTAGDTTGMVAFDTAANAALGTPLGTFPDFGGTTSSVHNFGFGGSVGIVHELTPGISISAAYKSAVKYDFEQILYQDVSAVIGGSTGFQTLPLETPAEIIVGIALDGVIAPNLLVEFDVVQKLWDDADALSDAFEDQLLYLLGAQLKVGKWMLRAGYSHHEDLLKPVPNSTLGPLEGLGVLPLGPGSASPALSTDLIAAVQTTLLPVIWKDSVTVGVGYQFNPVVSLDAYYSVGFSEEVTRSGPTLGALVGALAPGLGNPSWQARLDDEILFGLSLTITP